MAEGWDDHPTGVLPDGIPIKDVVALIKWLVNDIDPFAECLAEKLMIYATDRVLKHCEKRSLPRSCAGITPRMMVRGVTKTNPWVLRALSSP